MKIAVMGAGNIGSLFGGFLADAGNDVVLIGRKHHISIIQHNGLTIDGVSGRRLVRVKAVKSPKELKDTFDLILLTVKAYDTRQAIKEVKPLLNDDSILLFLQNGFGVERIASEFFMMDKVLRGVTSNGALRLKPGFVTHTGKGKTIIGELNNKITERARIIAETFSKADLPTNVTNRINVTVWIKLLVNAGINPFGALTGLKNGELLTIPGLKESMTETIIEGINLVNKLGIRLKEDPISLMIKTAKKTAQNRNSMLQDIDNGKQTEIDYINGAISDIGKKIGIKTPLNSLLTYLIKGLEKSYFLRARTLMRKKKTKK